MSTGRTGSLGRSRAAPTWTWMGRGGRPVVTPNCKGLSARSTQVCAPASREQRRHGARVGPWWREEAACWRGRGGGEPLGTRKAPYPFFGSSAGSPRSHKWSYSGSCPKSVEDSSWIPFRNHCYTFHMEVTLGQKEAMKRCQKAGGTVLSIQDEMENVFVWEHLQAYESQSKGAWLGMTFNPKGGTLVWHDNSAMNYSNWGQHDTGPSMLSQNSCYWIQSSNGVWHLGSCSNVTMGVICKIPRAGQCGKSLWGSGAVEMSWIDFLPLGTWPQILVRGVWAGARYFIAPCLQHPECSAVQLPAFALEKCRIDMFRAAAGQVEL
uniref:C-type lectin domain-containing protein n=1 Tax=Terrapene triunguis TaxID=2587831 RepID=A0A674J6B8_9SAUR